jgi:hypothetical protein
VFESATVPRKRKRQTTDSIIGPSSSGFTVQGSIDTDGTSAMRENSDFFATFGFARMPEIGNSTYSNSSSSSSNSYRSSQSDVLNWLLALGIPHSASVCRMQVRVVLVLYAGLCGITSECQ